jgi:hypothetical protein
MSHDLGFTRQASAAMSAGLATAAGTGFGAAPAASTGGSVPAPAGDQQPWILSPGYDLLLFVGVTLLTIIPWVVSDVLHYPGWYVLVGVAFVNGPHLISTWTRVYLPKGERFRRPVHYWVLPGAAAAFAIVNELRGGEGSVWVRSVIFYWATWHFAAQSWGVLRIYQRKHGVVGTLEAKLERALIFLPAAYCMLRRLYTGPWELFSVRVIHFRPTPLVVNAFGAVVLAVVGLYLVCVARGIRTRTWPRHAYLRPVYLAFNFMGFAMPFLVIRDGTSAFAAAALWHAVQYVAIVWLYNRRRYAKGLDPQARLVSWVSQPGRTLAYIGLIAACAAGVYTVAFAVSVAARLAFESLAMVFWTGLTLAHYYVDGVIWKTRRYDLRKTLDQGAAGAAVVKA